ncbi:MAG: hypothetical protein ACXV2G_00575, partial [Actinomycetes bacterium]
AAGAAGVVALVTVALTTGAGSPERGGTTSRAPQSEPRGGPSATPSSLVVESGVPSQPVNSPTGVGSAASGPVGAGSPGAGGHEGGVATSGNGQAAAGRHRATGSPAARAAVRLPGSPGAAPAPTTGSAPLPVSSVTAPVPPLPVTTRLPLPSITLPHL